MLIKSDFLGYDANLVELLQVLLAVLLNLLPVHGAKRLNGLLVLTFEDALLEFGFVELG